MKYRVLSFDIGIRNFAITILEYDNINKSWNDLKWIDSGVFSLVDGKDHAYSGDSDIAFSNIILILKNYSPRWLENKNNAKIHVAIEQQPFTKFQGSVRMKSISYIVWSFYKILYNEIIERISFISPAGKLRVEYEINNFRFSGVGRFINKQDTKTYTNRKKSAVILWSTIIYNLHNTLCTNKNLLLGFNASTKKDDLSDSALQAVYYLQTKA